MLISVKDVAKEFQYGKRTFKAVDAANLSLNTGDFISIMGKSGSGKSTLLNIIAGLTLPTSGSVEINGYTITSLSDREKSFLRNDKIGYVPQMQCILSNLTVLDNVRLPYYLTQRRGGSAVRARELLQRLNIAHLAESYPKHLSGGELRRVAIARALINDPDILIADEPTGDLDRQSTTEVFQLFKTLAVYGMAILIATHDLSAVDYDTKGYTMEAGVLSMRGE